MVQPFVDRQHLSQFGPNLFQPGTLVLAGVENQVAVGGGRSGGGSVGVNGHIGGRGRGRVRIIWCGSLDALYAVLFAFCQLCQVRVHPDDGFPELVAPLGEGTGVVGAVLGT